MVSSDLAFLDIGFVLLAIGLILLVIFRLNTSLYRLYGIAIENFELIDKEGICYLLILLKDKGLFSKREYNKIAEHFKSCNPSKNSKYKSFTESNSFTGNAWWWHYDKEGKEQRLLFLKRLQQDCK